MRMTWPTFEGMRGETLLYNRPLGQGIQAFSSHLTTNPKEFFGSPDPAIVFGLFDVRHFHDDVVRELPCREDG